MGLRAVCKPRWSDDRPVSYRIDTLATVLWIVDWGLWAIMAYAAIFGPAMLMLAALGGIAAARIAANLRLGRVVSRLETQGARAEISAARKPGATLRSIARRRMAYTVKRCEIKAQRYDVRAAAADEAGDEFKAWDMRRKAEHHRYWATESRQLAHHLSEQP